MKITKIKNFLKNYKIFIIFILFSVLFLSNLFSVSKKNTDLIFDIQIEGIENFNQSIVKDKITLKKKQVLNNEKISNDLREILETGYFEDVSVETKISANGLIVIYKVQEKPMINSLKFEGNENFKKNQLKVTVDDYSDEKNAKDVSVDEEKNDETQMKLSRGNKLKSKIELKENGFYDEYEIKKSKDAILEFYKEQGFGDASVDYIVEDIANQNKVNITFLIFEGKRLKLKDITISGNNAIKTKTILKALGIKRKKVFKEDIYKEGFKNIKYLYREEGFLDADIKEISRELDEKRENLSLIIEIIEGERYKIGDIKLFGNEHFSTDELTKLMKIHTDEIFKQTFFEESLFRLQNFYAEHGYIRASINPEILYKEKIVDINFYITENNIVYIDKIYVEGNEITKEYVIRRQFVIKEKAIFDINKVRRTQEKIFNLGFFRDVQIETDSSNQETIDLIYKVEEQPTGLATVGGGYSSQDGIIGTLQFTKRNLFGRGQTLNLIWEFGKTRENYQISFNDPYIFQSNIAFGIDIFKIKRDRDYIYKNDIGISKTDVYRERHEGGALKFGRNIFENTNINMTYGFDRVEITDVDTDPSEKHKPLVNEANKGIQDTSSLTFAIIRDTRDNIYYTKRGTYSRFAFKNAGTFLGGDNDFIKINTNGSYFLPLFWEFVLAFNIDLGLVREVGFSKDVPIYEKFYIGGAETVRGYDYRGDIGPEDGGNYKIVYNIEYKFPILKQKMQTILQGVFFFDAGGSWAEREYITFKIGNEANQMKTGVGFGIRFTTPIFPIRLDWGYGLNKEEGKTPSQFYFTIGQTF